MPSNQSPSILSKLFSAAILVALATMTVKIVAMGKEILLASFYGTSDQMDAFVLAFTIPSYIINVAAGSLNVALIPAYIQTLQQQGQKSANQLLQQTLLLNLATLVLLSLIIGLFAQPLMQLIGYNFQANKIDLSTGLFMLLLPTVAVSSASIILAAILNAHEKFFYVSLLPAIIPISLIATVYIFGQQYGAYAIALGTLLGYLLELLLSLFLLKRTAALIPLQIFKWHPDLKTVLNQYMPALSGSSLMCSAAAIDQIMAASLESGSLATLNYGTKLIAVITGIVTMALGTAALPYFSKLVSTAHWSEIRNNLKSAARLICLLTIPITITIIYGSELIVKILFERGKFSASDTHNVALVQSILALQIPFHTLAVLFVRMVSALKLNYLMLWSNIISLLVNISLNIILMQWFGILGIAISTVFVYFLAAIFLGSTVFRALKKLESTQ